MTIHYRLLPSGFWHVRGPGVRNYTQPPSWPCTQDMIRQYAHPEASEEFLRECEQVARDLLVNPDLVDALRRSLEQREVEE